MQETCTEHAIDVFIYEYFYACMHNFEKKMYLYFNG